MDKRYFSNKLAEWYVLNKRDLPWRQIRDPYRIWLSEVILQQTRVSQGLPYYQRFVERFENIHSLAAAPQQEVLRLWQGLGYYSRARNLHTCAQQVVREFIGMFPSSFTELRKLKGIGDYTAAAIASLAFQEPVAAVDGNVYRVLTRVFGIDTDITTSAGKQAIVTLANELVAQAQPDIHNQAMMEFGALHCTPRNPGCETCPFGSGCVASASGLQQMLPVKAKSKRPRSRYFYYLVANRGNSLLMGQRSGKDIWQGLYDFPLVELARPARPHKVIEQFNKKWGTGINGQASKSSPVYKHILSHQVIFSRFITVGEAVGFGESDPSLKFYSRKKIADLPKPALISRFLEDYKIL